MILRDVTFENVFCSPGMFGYFGEKRSLVYNTFLKDTVFVSKLVTAEPFIERPINQKTTFKNFFKSKNKVSKFGAGVVLLREDISGVGLATLLANKHWQQREKPFLISVTTVCDTPEERLLEIQKVGDLFESQKKDFKSHFGLVLCFSNPADDDYESLVLEINNYIDILSRLQIPLVVQVSLSFPPDMLSRFVINKNCSAVMIRPSILWSEIPEDARKVFFQMKSSRISQNDGGYVFGKYVFPYSLEWLRQAKKYSAGKPIIIGGGILRSRNVKDILEIGATGIIVDRATMLRIWNIPSIIKIVKRFFVRKK